MDKAMETRPVLGRYTYVPLDKTEPFFLPWEQDPWGRLRPPVSAEAMRLSLELAASVYDLELDNWLDAGWTDISIQIDNKVRSGIGKTAAGDTKSFLRNTWAIYSAKLALKQLNPISQVRSAIRQKEKSDTGKVLTMIKSAANGRYVVAIGFMGTGSRFYDWFSNFRFNNAGGMHQGFSQLARQFEGNEELIQFPNTAEELGLESLNLAQIVKEACSPNSRFLLWIAGHSQGGALMQVWGSYKLQENGVLPQNMLGYGFASPSVASGMALSDPSAFPFYHVQNSDDFVPRMGAQVHMGVCLVYPGDEKLRNHCYDWKRTEEAIKNRGILRRLTRRIVDTPSAMESGMAYVQLAFDQPIDDIHAAFSSKAWRMLPLKHMLTAADTREKDMLRFLERHVGAAYESITGEPIDQALIQSLKAEMHKAVEQIGFHAFNQALMELMVPPHRLAIQRGAMMGVYTYIVLRGIPNLHPAIWQQGQPPMRLWVTPMVGASDGGIYNRRLPGIKRRKQVHRHHGYTSIRETRVGG